MIAEDTDILVLLCHHLKPSTVGLFIKSDKTTSKYPLWDIKATCDQLGNRCCKFLPFLHALCGSDTTSRLYGIGKAVVIKKQEQLFKDGAVFLLRNSSKNVIKEAWVQKLLFIFMVA